MPVQIAISSIIRFLLYFIHWMVLAYLPVVFKGYGFTDFQIGFLIGLYSLSSMFLMLPLGLFSDFFSPKRTILLGSLLFAGYFFVLTRVQSFALMIPAILFGGIGAASLIVVTESLYLKLFGREKRGMRVAVYQVSTYIGFGIGPLVGGLLISHGPSLIFTVAMLGAILIFLFGLFLDDFEPISFSFKEYGKDILQFKPLLLLACIFVLGTHFGIEQTSFSLLMQEKLFFSARDIGITFAGIGLWMAAIVPFAGRLHDQRKDVFLFFLVGMGFSGLFQIFTAWAWDFRSLLIIRLLHTMGDTLALLELTVLIAMFFPSHRLGGNSGLMYALRTMATFIAAILAGGINKEWGYAASFLGNGIFVLVFVIVSVGFILSSRERKLAVGWVRD
ncbi:MAG: MFS transporter [Proteobacteria bacterium]|nr:MFS transporter [Pseudomonadota bacterium]